jgi:signal transduction histidine kinase
VYTDNGKGIDNAHLDKIFDMFFRASADSYGSGLGLYITRQVVKKLNGTIRVQSELGQGTQFIITLPNLRATAAAMAPSLPSPAP